MSRLVLQVYELLSGGAIPVHYEVDAAVLSQLQVDNFNHLVLRCLNPKGMVLPGQTTVLEWIFSPLEAKMYQVRMETYHWPLKLVIKVVWTIFSADIWFNFFACSDTDIITRTDLR